MKKLLLAKFALIALAPAALAAGPLETLAGLAPAAAEALPPVASPTRETRKFYIGETSFETRDAALAKAGEYAAAMEAAGLKIVRTAAVTREDGDRDLYMFSIEYAGDRTLKTETMTGIPDKAAADLFLSELSIGLSRAGMAVVRSGVRKEAGGFTFYCLYAQADADPRAVHGYASLPLQSAGLANAGDLFPCNMENAAREMETSGLPVVFKMRRGSEWLIKFVGPARPKQLKSDRYGNFFAAMTDMRRTADNLARSGKIVLDANTSLSGLYWTIDYLEKP